MVKKGQTFKWYTLKIKWVPFAFVLEEGMSYRSFVSTWRSGASLGSVTRYQKGGESLKDHRGLWNQKHFDCMEDENSYLKSQVDFLKKRHPNLLEE